MFLRVTRWIPASGIAFVLLVVIAALLTRDSPGGDTSEAEIASYYADGDNLDAERISFSSSASRPSASSCSSAASEARWPAPKAIPLV